MFYENQILDQTYQIIRKIGKGGTGTVYLAYHLRLQKYVVVKQLQKTDISQQFRREVDILKTLHHPNLPQVYDFIQQNQAVYTVMDFIEGTDLEYLRKSGYPFSFDNLKRWLTQLVEVLEYLHGQNPAIIHSDIKPSNIIITPQNNAVLIDFNVSLYRSTDTVIGLSLDYASPEQISIMQQISKGQIPEESLDGRSDIYSLCASFYHLMCGRKPSVFYPITPLLEQETDYPETFCRLIDQGMRKEKEERFASATQLKKALDRMWKDSRQYKQRMAFRAAIVVLAACLLAFASYRLISGIREKQNQEFLHTYNQCIQSINSNTPDIYVSDCLQFLNNNEDKLNQDFDKKGALLAGIAEGYREQRIFEGAIPYYEQALECFDPENPALINCYTGLITSYIQTGNSAQAEYAFALAEAEGIKNEKLTLLEIQLYSAEQKTEECLGSLKKLEEVCKDRSILARAYLAAAECEQPDSDKKKWLDNARMNLDYDLSLQRQLGYDYLQLGSESLDANVSQDAFLKAVESYQKIVDHNQPGFNDYYNLINALRFSEQFNEALKASEALEISKIPKTDQGLLFMQRAFLFQDMGNTGRMREAAAVALQHLKEQDVSSEEWNALQQMAQ